MQLLTTTLRNSHATAIGMSQAVIALQRYNFLRTQNPKTNEKMNNAPNGSDYATAFGQMRQQPASAICPQARLTVPKAAAQAMHIYIVYGV